MSCIITGWGEERYGSTSHLKATNLKFMKDVGKCQGRGYKWFICSYAKGGSLCSGDSGGLLTVNENGVHVVVGVVSAGWINCSVDYPFLFTRVTSVLPWIRENIMDGDCDRN